MNPIILIKETLKSSYQPCTETLRVSDALEVDRMIHILCQCTEGASKGLNESRRVELSTN